MSINLILAVGRNGEVGQSDKANGLPWNNPEDMKFFKETTKYNQLIVGRKTFENFKKLGLTNGLPERHHIIVSSSYEYEDYEDDKGYTCEVIGLESAIRFLRIQNKNDNPIFIIGGVSIYNQLHYYADTVYLTRMDGDYPDADSYIDLGFLKDFNMESTLPLNDYSWVEVYKRDRFKKEY